MKVNLIYFRWAWTTLLAVLCLGVLAALDLKLKGESGHGVVDLQKVWTAGAAQDIIAAWSSPRRGAMAGFGLGFDYLFMPLYGFAFYYGTLAAREAFAGNSRLLRRLFNFAAAIPLAGALADAVENALEFQMVMNGATSPIALYAYTATTAKFVCFYIGLGFTLLGLLGLLFRRGKKEAAA